MAPSAQRTRELIVERLSKRYGASAVVDDVSFEAKAGEFVTLLGPSGSGKTSTLMMIAGLVTPSAGDIRISGRSIVDAPPYRRDLGVIFQQYALFPHMTVFENVAYPLRCRRQPADAIRTKVAQAIELVGLAGFEQRYPKQMSGGQQQRVALARAVVFEPSVLLMDEPLSALDRKLRERMRLELKQLQQRLGVTVIFVTHDQEEALALSDRVIVMDGGRIVQSGAPDEIYGRPQSEFVADFIGETNLLNGRIAALREGIVEIAWEGGGMLCAEARDALAVGDAIRLSLRPTRIAFGAPGTANPTALNRVDGVVEGIEFQGELTSFSVRSRSGFVFIVKRLSYEANRPRPGQAVTLHWCAGDSTVVARHG